jgi:hypothetical protein
MDELAYSIYPNPSSGTLYIKNASNIKRFQVMNAFGQVLSTKEINNQELVVFQIEASRGVYFVNITTKDGKSEIRKVIIR